jgi:hypothetical protein
MNVILSTPVDRSPSSIELRARRHTQAWRERLDAKAEAIEAERRDRLATAA